MRWRISGVEGKAELPYILRMIKPLRQNELTVTAKGQVSLRKEVLAHLGVAPGDKLRFERLPNGEVRIRRAAAGHSLADLAGMLKPPHGTRLTIEEMNEVIARGWADEG